MKGFDSKSDESDWDYLVHQTTHPTADVGVAEPVQQPDA
jgi:hypothetical protein